MSNPSQFGCRIYWLRFLVNLEGSNIKRAYMLFISVFVLVTILSISGLILVVLFDNQDMNNYVETESQQKKNQSEYWTKERMQEAEPQLMPTESKSDNFKEFVRDILPISIILFIILTAVLNLINIRKINLLEKKLIDKSKLLNCNDRQNE